MAYPTTLALITALWSGPARTRSIALWAATGGALTALGPLLAGVLLQHFSWGSPFLLTLPFAVLALLMAIRFIPANVNETHRTSRPPGRCAHDLPGRRLHPRHQPGGRSWQGVGRDRAVRRRCGGPGRVLHPRATGGQSPLRPARGLTANLLGGGGRRDHRLRLPDGDDVHRAAIPAERPRLLDRRRRSSDPARGSLHGARRAAVGQAGRGTRGARDPALRLCLRPARLPHHADPLEGGHLVLEGGPRLRLRRHRRRPRRHSGVALADGLRAGETSRNGLRDGRPSARSGWRDPAIDHGGLPHRRLRRRCVGGDHRFWQERLGQRPE